MKDHEGEHAFPLQQITVCTSGPKMLQMLLVSLFCHRKYWLSLSKLGMLW